MSPNQDLFAAIATGDQARLTELLAEQPDLVNVRSQEGLSSILWAHYTNNIGLLPILLAAHPHLDIHDIAALGDLDRLQALLADDPSSVCTYSNDGFTALHYVAFFSGNATLAALLLDAGAKVDAVTHNRQQLTPLHSAAAHQHYAIIQLLLAHGAQVNARQEGGATPLMAAAQNGDTALAETLLAHGADPTVTMDDGQTAADFALSAGHTALATMLHAKMA